ncbi:MAG: septal ring lytic transglycosylase RlpA family protein [Rhizobiales bacterium]|nr:septal ring lytic transglycosylase RlpA family protein [Hyphomicrobiales bacterium]
MGGIGGNRGFGRLAHLLALAVGCLALANCSGGGKLDPKYGVSASARVVEPGDPVPKGGGVYRVGKPYTIAGREYVPQEDVNYSAVGMASFYGNDFHGRSTANGEVFDMNSISAAHPTLPLPSYVRVTNLANRRSIVVRVNDRGPYVGDRVIDLSAQTAKLLGFHGHGLAKVKVDYVGRAPLEGSDDRKLMATLREGAPATVAPVQVASNKPYAPAFFDNRPMTQYSSMQGSSMQEPAPPNRPYRLGEGARELPAQNAPQAVPRTPTVELAAAARSQAPPFAARAPRAAAEPSVSPVSAYASPRYDGSAGFMSGRGLY